METKCSRSPLPLFFSLFFLFPLFKPALGDQIESRPDSEKIRFSADGYLRLRSKLYQNLDLTRELKEEDTTAFLDARGMLLSNIGTDKIQIRSRLDFVDNSIWGFNSPSSREHPLVETVSFHDIDGKEVSPIKLKWLYLWAMSPVGLFEVGIVPSHWGFGIFQNSSTTIFDDYGDSFARAMFVTMPVEKFYVGAIYDKVTEGPISKTKGSFVTDAEIDEAGVVALYNHEKFVSGIYSVVRWQSWTDSLAAAFDLYGETKNTNNFYAGFEGVFITGKFIPKEDQNIDVLAYGGALRVGYKGREIFPNLEIGYTSPESDDEYDPEQNSEGKKISSFSFDPDYSPALLMFNTTGGGKIDFKGKLYTPVVESRTVKNAFYSRFEFLWSIPGIAIKIIPSAIIAFNSKNTKFLGIEPDFELRREKDKGIFLSFKTGYLFVGDELKKIERKGEQGTTKSNLFGVVATLGYVF